MAKEKIESTYTNLEWALIAGFGAALLYAMSQFLAYYSQVTHQF